MAKIQLSHPNPFSVEEAKKIVTEVFLPYKSQFGLNSDWNGDILVVSGKGAEGKVSVSVSSIDLQLELGFAASMFKGKIESGIRSEIIKRFPLQ